MKKLGQKIIDQLEEEARDLKSPAERGQWINRMAESLNVSRGTIYRALQSRGVTPTRNSNGGRKISHNLTNEQIELILAQIHLTRRKTGKNILPIEMAIKMAEMRDEIPANSITVYQLKYEMSKRGLLVRDIMSPPPTSQKYSKYPGQVHQFDWSMCLYWKFPPLNKRMKILSWCMDLEPNKIVEEIKTRRTIIWRGVLWDHFSSSILVKYYEMAGESAYDTMNCLMWGWMQKSNPAIIVHGLPEILLVDRGVGNNNAYMKNLCRNYNINLRFHTPGVPWATGGVEGSHNIVETHFESMITANPPYNIDELNERAEAWMVEYNTKKILMRNGMPVDTRWNLWQKNITSDRLRVPASVDEFKMAASREVVSKKVSGLYTVRIAPESSSKVLPFLLPKALHHLAGKRVYVVVNPFYWREDASVLVSERGRPSDPWYMARKIDTRAGGFLDTAQPIYHARTRPTNTSEDFRRRADELTLRPARTEIMTPDEQIRIAAELPLPSARQQRPVNDIPAITCSPFDARTQIMQAIPDLSPALKRQLRDEINSPLTTDQLRMLISKYEDLSNHEERKQNAVG